VSLVLAVGVCAAAHAAEPAVTAPSPAVPAAHAAPVAAPAPPRSAAGATSKPIASKPLDLRIGDVRKYMMPNEFREAISAPDADKNTVVVEGDRELLPVKHDDPVPGGIIAPLWALTHPLQGWRIFVPDLNRPEERPREPEDRVPPPVFRWGP
jgi:hypothetical protein